MRLDAEAAAARNGSEAPTRLERLVIAGSATTYSYFACVIEDSETWEIYDATTQVLTLRVELTPDTAYPGARTVYKLPLARSQQTANNKPRIEEVALAVTNASFAAVLAQTSHGVARRGSEGTLAMANSRATPLRESLRALAVFVPKPPYTSIGRSVVRGGPSEPGDAVIDTTFIHAELTDLWWFSTATGEVIYRRAISPRGEVVVDGGEWDAADAAAKRALAEGRTGQAWESRPADRILIKTSDGRTVGYSYRPGLVVVYGEHAGLEAPEAKRFAELLRRAGVVSLIPGPHYEIVLDPAFWERLDPTWRQRIASEYVAAVWTRAAPSKGVLLRTSEGRAVAFSARPSSVTLEP